MLFTTQQNIFSQDQYTMISRYTLYNFRRARPEDGCGYHQLGNPCLFRIDCCFNEVRNAIPLWKRKRSLILGSCEDFYNWLLMKSAAEQLPLLGRKK